MLPKQLKFGSKVESAAAKSSRVNIAPSNGTGPYNLGDTIIFNIPTRASLVLVPNESYLKFNLNPFTVGATQSHYRWDSCGAHGIIQRIRIFHGSNLLQDIDNYSLLTKMLYDIQVPGDACYGKLNVLAGTRSDLVVTPQITVQAPAITATAANYASTTTDGTITQPANANIIAAVTASLNAMNAVPVPAVQINSGDVIKSSEATPKNTITNTTSSLNTYCLNLNCLLGTLCSQNYWPLFACTSAPLRMEIQIVSDLFKAMNCTTIPTFGANTGLISNVEYIANFIELGDSAMSVVANSLQGQPLQFVVPDYRNYQFSYSLAQNPTVTQVSMAIPAKFSSLKSLFITVRDQGAGALTFFPNSSVTMNITDYQFRIGSSIFPPKAVNTLPEMFSEVLKAIGSMSDLNYQPSIEKSSYTQIKSNAVTAASEANGAGAVGSGSFYIGIDLENYINANKDNIFSGWNSNTDDIFAIMNFAGPAAGPVTTRFDAFANFDTCVVFENGTAYVRY